MAASEPGRNSIPALPSDRAERDSLDNTNPLNTLFDPQQSPNDLFLDPFDAFGGFGSSLNDLVESLAEPSPDILETISETTEVPVPTKSKRHRNDGRADALSACWTSPLCPNNNKEGTPPNPSTCGGGCAPFLFDTKTEDSPQTDISSLNEPVNTLPRTSRPMLKRIESASDAELGRSFAISSSGSPNTVTSAEDKEDAEYRRPTPKSKAKVGRQPHTAVERKYRDSINNQLECLRKVVPSLQHSPDDADIEDLPAPPSKPSKAMILASATAHIKHVEKEKKRLSDENLALRAKIKSLQALVKCDDCSLMHYVMDMKIRAPS
ncbi:hypothetical protein LTS18_008917 [Coniosporium uncinatum]|uniref:Uncharacterized protein n=1 Tax=Coniosporium uncinatum TaxID=93489 RepID=A0ACC3DAM7_9PEZI|nr:hypothetical protein LTS18_008917 [Coniosporium uncinatum]